MMSLEFFKRAFLKLHPILSTTVSASLDVHEWICFGVVFNEKDSDHRHSASRGDALPVGKTLLTEVRKVLCGKRLPPWTYIYT